jgi:tRNA A37 threonylcarbamoyladenosine modification protein TsaB
MTLYINTKEKNKLIVALKSDDKVIKQKEVVGEKASGEKLLIAIDEIIKEAKIKLTDLKKIEVENKGDSFTSLRVGVTVANALGFTLSIPVEGMAKSRGKTKIHHPRPLPEKGGWRIVEPIYNKITW